MKTLRICLVVLLAILLPAKGAVAAAMPCPFVHGADHGEMADPAAMDMTDMDMPQAMAADDDTAASHDDAHVAAAAECCHLCAASCSAAAIAGGAVPIASSQLPGPVPRAAPAPAVGRFLQDGPDRPPRTS